jgi:HEAT repeat protein
LTTNDLGEALVLRTKDAAYWKKCASSADPSLRGLAVAMLFKNTGAAYEKDLVSIYHADASFNVRLAALRCLATLRSSAFEKLLNEAALDPYEYIRRLTAMWMGEVGKTEYLPLLSALTLSDPSERVKYNSREAMERISPSKALEAMTAAIRALPQYPPTDKVHAEYTRSLTYAREKIFGDLIPNMTSDTLSVKKRVNVIRNFRLYNYHEAIPALVSIAVDAKEQPQVRAAALEAMGWYSLAVERPVLLDACAKVAADATAPAPVRTAAIQTKNRLAGGPNEVLTP